MFVNWVEYPPIKRGKEEEFKQWFKWSISVYQKFDGFISRRLLQPVKEKGNYVVIMEHESEKTYEVMHFSKDVQEARKKSEPLLDGLPTPHYYEVVISSEKGG